MKRVKMKFAVFTLLFKFFKINVLNKYVKRTCHDNLFLSRGQMIIGIVRLSMNACKI